VWTKCREKEAEIQKRSREIAISLNLEMKLSDVEFQGDGSKATFYYTAEERVDFRQLIKDMAKAFGIRIEMRQIGYRQEAQRLGGIGSCGRELCCSTWLTDFRSVGTASARYQQLSLNPQKLAGQCGKLKCCLNYELDVYMDALKDFPRSDTKLMTEKGIAYCQKVDIFKEKLWFTYKNDPITWHMLTKDQVNEIVELNKKDQSIQSLESYSVQNISDDVPVYEDAVGQDSLTRFDRPKRSKNKSNNKSKKSNKNRPHTKGRNQNRNRGKNNKGSNRNGNKKTAKNPS
jgi:cell fate regulator YaaT (PSP1 superfamily)